MLILFINHAGVVSKTKLIPGPGRSSVNAVFYRDECLKILVQAVHKSRLKIRTREILLHHDNASSHNAGLAKIFSKEKDLRLLPHLAYSPDLARCDYYLLPKFEE